ncbi:hypothetical protein ASG12_13490 [Williamsia sp. Leaf354]|uniref:M4 family metallopeptidase n=1 Tax=Williamsia sp. Leaf354 TaxID=1736349 RepID=UPI0006F36171|nr:M4 family metallopeptidase [Williamsia sp. Leaf354]KQR97998.1 hypothetical protein ASG12_13490 [Williamsia sp. Leaf354]
MGTRSTPDRTTDAPVRSGLSRLRIGAIAVAITATCVVGTAPALAAPPSTPSSPGDDLSSVPKEVVTGTDGKVAQASPDTPLRLATPTADPNAAADKHAQGVQKTFRADDVGTLKVESVYRTGSASTVRLRQVIDGVPVYGATVSQSLDSAGSLLAATGETAQAKSGSYVTTAVPTSVVPAAIAGIASTYGKKPERLKASAARANWYDPTLAGKDGTSVAVPAYRVKVKAGAKQSWLAFIGQDGAFLDSISLTAEALNRVVCDANRRAISTATSTGDSHCGGTSPFTPTRIEGQAASSVADVNSVYGFLSDTQTFYSRTTGLADLTDLIGADTGDGRGKALRATVRLCSTEEGCPFTNAYWDEDHMAYGEGVTTDDITAHELSHGVTQNVNGLQYRNESGAINESMSDVFGELTDLTNGSADDTAANRWLIGEGSSLGAIRNMRSPGSSSPAQAEIYKGTNWYSGTNQSAFVHYNSSVGNKAAYLIADGATFNGQTITGIGVTKTAQLYWTTQTLLTANATYRTLGAALKAACSQNVAGSVAATTSTDCAQVAKVVTATKM